MMQSDRFGRPPLRPGDGRAGSGGGRRARLTRMIKAGRADRKPR